MTPIHPRWQFFLALDGLLCRIGFSQFAVSSERCYLINIVDSIYYDCCVVQYNDKFDQELNSNEFKFPSNYQVLLTSVWGKHRVYCWYNPFAVVYFKLSSKTVKKTNRD